MPESLTSKVTSKSGDAKILDSGITVNVTGDTVEKGTVAFGRPFWFRVAEGVYQRILVSAPAGARGTMSLPACDGSRDRGYSCHNVMMRDVENCKRLSVGDLVLSVLPWPFRRDLPPDYCGKASKATFWDLFMFALPGPLQRDLPDGENGDDGEKDDKP